MTSPSRTSTPQRVDAQAGGDAVRDRRLAGTGQAGQPDGGAGGTGVAGVGERCAGSSAWRVAPGQARGRVGGARADARPGPPQVDAAASGSRYPDRGGTSRSPPVRSRGRDERPPDETGGEGVAGLRVDEQERAGGGDDVVVVDGQRLGHRQRDLAHVVDAQLAGVLVEGRGVSVSSRWVTAPTIACTVRVPCLSSRRAPGCSGFSCSQASGGVELGDRLRRAGRGDERRRGRCRGRRRGAGPRSAPS